MKSKKDKTVSATLNYIKHLLILASAVSECIATSVFVSLVGMLIDVTSSAEGLKSCKTCSY